MSNMKKTRFTETQIVKAIQEHENGRKAEDVYRELGISTSEFVLSIKKFSVQIRCK